MTLNCKFFRKDIAPSVDLLQGTQEMRVLKKLLHENSSWTLMMWAARDNRRDSINFHNKAYVISRW
jgi:hypothetical protein